MAHSDPSSIPLHRYSSKKERPPVAFRLRAPEAVEVHLVGDFNDWDPRAHPMERHQDGTWYAQIPLPQGQHHYRFVVDGRQVLDPEARGQARDLANTRVSLLEVE